MAQQFLQQLLHHVSPRSIGILHARRVHEDNVGMNMRSSSGANDAHLAEVDSHSSSQRASPTTCGTLRPTRICSECSIQVYEQSQNRSRKNCVTNLQVRGHIASTASKYHSQVRDVLEVTHVEFLSQPRGAKLKRTKDTWLQLPPSQSGGL